MMIRHVTTAQRTLQCNKPAVVRLINLEHPHVVWTLLNRCRLTKSPLDGKQKNVDG